LVVSLLLHSSQHKLRKDSTHEAAAFRRWRLSEGAYPADFDLAGNLNSLFE
jgi:hypothetical protein